VRSTPAPDDLQTDLPLTRLLRPFIEFARIESSGGIVLLACAALAMLWANSPIGQSYTALWDTPVAVAIGGFKIAKPLLLWINDGLMAVFFFVVGLEIKREVLVGELSTGRKAALPVAAAIGGMLVPAAIYAAINAGGPGLRGWGVPMATDIAFALGVLALLGERVPAALKIFLTALAIADDLGAVLVIALFYTEQIAWNWLGLGAAMLVMLALANALGVRALVVYLACGLVLWVAFLKSGIHATVSGVLLAMTIPARARIDGPRFLAAGRSALETFSADPSADPPGQLTADQQSAVMTLEEACEAAGTPLQRLEHALHPWVGFFIMPVFALANAGVAIGGNIVESLAQPVSLGVLGGLVLGKPLGVIGASWLAVRSGLAVLPDGISWQHIRGAGCLAGIGFTMSLFIASLAFGESDLLPLAKIGILTASVASGVIGAAILARVPRPAAAA